MGVMPQDLGDNCIDSLRMAQNLIVPEAQNPISLVLQELRSAFFRLGLKVVLTAIDFHDQSSLMAGEVRDITTDRNLASETVPIHLA